MDRPRHPDKHIEKAIRYAVLNGWRVEMSNGHCWGHLLCPRHTRDGCIIPVYSTPRNCQHHANHITRDVDKCPHPNTTDEDETHDE